MMGDMTDELSLNSNLTSPKSNFFPSPSSSFPPHGHGGGQCPQSLTMNRSAGSSSIPSIIIQTTIRQSQSQSQSHEGNIKQSREQDEFPSSFSPNTTLNTPIMNNEKRTKQSKPLALAIITKNKPKGLFKQSIEPKLWATDERNDISNLDEVYQQSLSKMFKSHSHDQLESHLEEEEYNYISGVTSSTSNFGSQKELSTSHPQRNLNKLSNQPSLSQIQITAQSYTGQPNPNTEATANQIIPDNSSSNTAPQPDENKLNIVESKAKNKLQNLNKFVMGHTSRKITSNWDLIENKFQSSTTHEIIMIKGENGIGNPVKYKTLTLSSLTLLLCSNQIQIKYKELVPLYEMLKFSKEQLILSCKLAARKLVMTSSTRTEVQEQCQHEIDELLALLPEPKVRIDLLKECIFSSDPKERKNQFQQLEKFRNERVTMLLEEKKRKKENFEKSEARKKKAISDFENCLCGIQYSRGVLNKKRLSHLKNIIEFCTMTLLDEYYEKTVAVDPLVIELIGPEMFPQTTNETNVINQIPSSTPSSTLGESKILALRKAGIFRKDYPPEKEKVDLVGPPTLVNLFRQTLFTGKGLYGTSNTDVVELLQSYCATRIGCFYRGYSRRWRYRVARKAWKHLYHFMKSKVFVAWAIETKKIRTLRSRCQRKLSAWRFFTRRSKRRRYYFRVCYWPLFIWRRYAIETAKAREKTKFLVGRVLPTLSILSTFRAWKKYYLNEVSYNKPASEFYRNRLHMKLHARLNWWVYWVRRRKGLRRGWIEKGYIMRCVKIEDCIRLPFQIWRATTAFKVRLRDFVKKNTYKFRQFILPNISIHLPPVKVKLTEEDKLKLLEDVTLESSVATSEDSLNTKLSRKLAKAKLKALRRVQTTSDVEQSDRSISTVELQAFSRQLGAKFAWKDDMNRFDIDAGEDEMLHISPFFHDMHNRYCQLHPEAFNDEYEGVNYGLKFRVIKKSTKSLIDEIKERFYEVEIWSLFEAAFCYHRMAHRVFHNLRVHAIVSRNKKRIKFRYRDNLLRKVLYALFRWATRGLDDVIEDSQANSKDGPVIAYSRAEELAFRSRTARMEKLKKRRDAARAFKEHEAKLRETTDHGHTPGIVRDESQSEDMDDYSVDAGPRARQRRLALEFKRINAPKKGTLNQATSGVLSAFNTTPSGSKPESLFLDALGLRRPSDQSESSLSFGNSETILEVEEEDDNSSLQSFGNKSLAVSVMSVNQPAPIQPSPMSEAQQTQQSLISLLEENKLDMLEWDRQERDQEMDLMQLMMKYGQQVKEETKKTVRQAAKETAKNTAVNDTRDEILQSIFNKEELKTDKSILRELDYVSSWKIKMAARMVDTLCKVHHEVILTLIEAEKRKYFRMLRLPLLLARSIHMCNRKKIANWIRICRRLGVLYDKAQFFRSLKLKWGFFNRWLKFYEKENLNCTSTLIPFLKKRLISRDSFCAYLKQKQFTKSVYPRNGRLKSVGHELKSIFLRWKEYTQDSVMLELMTQKVDAFHRVRLLQKCFHCLNTKMSLKYSYEQRKNLNCFSYIRALTDVEQISKRYFAKKRRSLSHIIRKYQLKAQILLKKTATKSVNFKSFITSTEKEVELRSMTEQKLMLTAFENRGTLQYQDILVNSNIPKASGERFSDPKPTVTNGGQWDGKQDHTIVPSGFNISKIKVALQHGLGIVGWQIIWSADSCVPIESTPRGKVVGSSITQQEFIMKQYDYLVEIEYCTEGAVIIGIRFCTYLNGWSKWIGNRGNQLSKKYRLNCSQAEVDPNEPVYKPSGHQEITSPGMPWEYIIGFCGLESSVRATGMGIIARRVSFQNIFSYHWVNESIYFQKLFAPQQDPSVKGIEELISLPSIGPGGSAGGIRPQSAAQKRNMDLLRHLTDLQTEQLSSQQEGDYLEVQEKVVPNLKPSEEQFFDVVRMRSVEIKAAQVRAITFARNCWTSNKIRFHPELSAFSTLTVITRLTSWLLESLCKSLVQRPEDPTLISKLYTNIHFSQVELEILENRLINAISSIETTELSEIHKPWYGKVLLGPQLRQQKKVFNEHISQLKENQVNIENKIILVNQQIQHYQEEADKKMPKFCLSLSLCNNFRLKIDAARYKSNLLEKMTIESLKEHLGGRSSKKSQNSNNSQNGLSDADHERIQQAKNRINSNDPTAEMKSLLQMTSEHEDELRHSRNSVADLYEKTSFPFLQLRSITAPNQVTLNSDMSITDTRKKSFRKNLAVNPSWGVSPARKNSIIDRKNSRRLSTTS